MSKRYIRIDLEYESNGNFNWNTMHSLKRIIEEDMPYVRVIFSRDSPSPEGLNEDNHEIERLKK